VDAHGVCFSAASYGRWHDVFDLPRSRLAPATDLAGFYRDLEEVYRSRPGPAPREAPDTAAVRLEAVARYLGLRVEGCDHDEATRRTLAVVSGLPGIGLCGTPALHHQLPPPDATYAFARQLDEALRTRAGAVRSMSPVDLETETISIHAYLDERLSGARDRDARRSVLGRIR
jgi:hypothetical protein